MKPITASVYTFEDLITGNFLYIDKSEYYWELIKNAKGIYFMSRPRRFGKSLTVSALHAIFSGKRELFKGLALDSKPYDWEVYPIIHLNMAQGRMNSVELLSETITYQLDCQAKRYGITLTHNDVSLRFEELINALASNGQKVVILIDEYDKPILNNFLSPQIKDILYVLKGFYNTIKTCESKERFVFMTGVTKFSMVSAFSGFNNLQDLTMDARFANIMGYTQEELEANFDEYLKPLAEKQKIDYSDFLAKIKLWYGGFRFSENSETVYNPTSLASFILNQGNFKNFWFETGTPSFLLEFAKTTDFNIEETLAKPVSELAFYAYEVGNASPITLMIQTGYLTIKSTSERITGTGYILDFPNQEVKAAFQTYFKTPTKKSP